MIPPEPAIVRIMAETGMDRMQAIRHLQQRATLLRRATIRQEYKA
jgi:hypothetical protein